MVETSPSSIVLTEAQPIRCSRKRNYLQKKKKKPEVLAPVRTSFNHLEKELRENPGIDLGDAAVQARILKEFSAGLQKAAKIQKKNRRAQEGP
mmetsp:Transcript_5506/g.8150  ORF Transcript_5506/g.8150 Transcript_5506/m.8150 type:complete len:93 (-) Transcript_5506:183-461(-)